MPAALAQAARAEELKFLASWHVWDVRPISECWAKTGKAPQRGRWVDHNKGVEANPNARSRYVATYLAKRKDDSMSAAPPPLEAVRMLLSDLAARHRDGSGQPDSAPGSGRRKAQRKAIFIDVKKAH